MKRGVITKSRNEGNFTKRMDDEKREHYIKDWIARCNAAELLPFIKITKRDRYFREIKYEIKTGATDVVKKGVTHNSRRDSDYILSLSKEKREKHIKQFIAAVNPTALIPFITITGHDENFRRIEYEINTDAAN